MPCHIIWGIAGRGGPEICGFMGKFVLFYPGKFHILPIIIVMVQMLLFLRFKAQLRRTRPELISRLEDAVTRAVEDAGGKITTDRRYLAASFDEDSLGFWLDMLILIETMLKSLDFAAADLYGYSLILSRSQPEKPDALCRFLAGGSRGGGVFLDGAARKGLSPYVVEEPGSVTLSKEKSPGRKAAVGDYYKLKEFKTFIPWTKSVSLQETAIRALEAPVAGGEQRRNTLILGPPFVGKRESLYRFCKKLLSSGNPSFERMGGDFPPLCVRFGGGGLNALIDAWSPPIRALASPGATDAGEIHRLWEFLFRERLREELSPFIIREARRFFILLLEFYTSVARRKGLPAVLVLENIHRAEQTASGLFIDVYAGMWNIPGLVVMGICDEPPGKVTTEGDLRRWETVFPRIIRPNAEVVPAPRPPEMPLELWEMAYTLSLLSRYFPASLFIRLFEEEGKNPVMVERALSMLAALGVIDSPRESCPWMGDFTEQAEAALGETRERARALVRSRLLSWVEQKKINSCFRFLMILADLGGANSLTDQLILRSIASDLANGAASGVKQARDTGLLENLVGPRRAAAVCFIFETTRALLGGNEIAARSVFVNSPPDCALFPTLKAQALINLSGYYLGERDNAAALETIKEAILLSQGKHNFCLAHSYRLFSLVSLARQQTGEAINYLSFAIDNAEKSGDYYETGVSAYYAAAAHFLYGNVSRAAALAHKAREQTLAAGCPEWADRSRFLEGRFAFETGRYQEALDLFEELRREPLGAESPEKERLLAAWAYRSRVYLQNPLSQKPASGGHDADLFEVEAAYLAGNYQKTVELAGALSSPHTGENFLYVEQPDWRSGFAQCELLYFSRRELWERMICVYHSLALCRLSSAGGEEAMHNMQRILKDEQFSDMDPADAFYFYAWYRVLEQTGAGQVGINTAVSIAFKRLQRRASHIDDIETRRQFLSKPRWNNALSLAAREFKLI
jgi:tetratricopeptide (TPR) repeat protein